MNISEKRYPYPVLKPEGDDYEGSSFDVAIEVLQSSETVAITFGAELKDDGLRRLIGVEHRAEIVCHLECPKTVYRQVVKVGLPVCEKAGDGEKVTLEIPTAALSGDVSVCPFIVATEDIPDYTNESFNPDYECEAFAIETGAVMAEGRQKTFEVVTAKEALDLSPSIFSVAAGGTGCKTLCMEWMRDKILIRMPERVYDKYGTLKDNPEDRETIWAMVFVPALVNVLATLSATRRLDKEQLADYADLRWYGAIDRALQRHYGFGIDSERFAGCDCLEAASVIIKNCVNSAFVNMARGWAEEGVGE